VSEIEPDQALVGDGLGIALFAGDLAPIEHVLGLLQNLSDPRISPDWATRQRAGIVNRHLQAMFDELQQWKAT
jgi:hypothetical protein